MNLANYHHSPLVRRAVPSVVPIACPPEVEEHGIVDAVVDHFELSLRSLLIEPSSTLAVTKI